MHSITTASPTEFLCGEAKVQIFRSSESLAFAAARHAAQIVRAAIESKGRARIMAATGNSQIAFVTALTKEPLDWNLVELFHMDEYVGISADHPASFRRWIRERIEHVVHPRAAYYLEGDAPDLELETTRYSELLQAAPIDVAFVGFGENGHIAFNDPPVADFKDPFTVKKVVLDEACRKQQAGEGHFKDVDSVPKDALTVTCSGLFRANAWICCVPDPRKAAAVRDALEGEISERCPASLARKHPNTHVYLDADSAALLRRP
jgi:glucosamine-6-phosphate deaminase